MVDLILLVQVCCVLCKGSDYKFGEVCLVELLLQVFGWELSEGGQVLMCIFCFKDYYVIMVFVNVLVWIVYCEDYYLDLGVYYDCVVVCFFIYDVGGLSENDFICVVKILVLME